MFENPGQGDGTRLQALLKAADDAKERAALEEMVRSVVRSPDLMAMAHDFAQQGVDQMRALPPGDPGRKSLDADELGCRVTIQLGAIVSISQALRGRVRDAGPIPSPGLSSWDPGEGPKQ